MVHQTQDIGGHFNTISASVVGFVALAVAAAIHRNDPMIAGKLSNDQIPIPLRGFCKAMDQDDGLTGAGHYISDLYSSGVK